MNSWKKPTPEQIEKAIALLIHPQQRLYLFNHLKNPLWIEPLEKKGFFKNPPSVISNSEGGGVSFPFWAESSYLVRMAEYEPNAVLKIAKKIETETDNPRVHEDFVDAALKMPPELAIQLIPKIEQWIASPYSSYSDLLPEKIGELFVYLAKGNQVKKAIELARLLLAIPEPRLKNEQVEVKSRFSDWEYEQILKNYIPELVTVAGQDALIMLGYILSDAIKFSPDSREKEQNQDESSICEDHSLYWRPVIEEHSRNSGSDEILQSLAVAIRDAAEQIVKNDQSKIREIVLLLKKWHWRIFHKIALYLIRKFPDADPQLIAEELANPKYFDNSQYQDYEYIFLAKEHFANLTIETQETILSQIENPIFDLDWIENQENKAKYLRRWQLKKLTPLKDVLPENWQQRYEQLVKEFGTIELSDLFSGGVGKVRYVIDSPKTASDLVSMSDEELISFLKNWQPTNKDFFDSLSPEGLGVELGKATEQDPERFAVIAKQFQGLHPRYGCGILRGLHNAINNKKGKEGELKQINWLSVLQLCDWIVQESQSVRENEGINSNHISDWGEPRQAVADLLAVGLSVENILEIPFNFRSEVWDILKTLTQDPEPTPEYEIRYGGSNMTPSELSINTVRGQAMHTVILYALWIRRHFEQITDGQQFIEQGFDEMSEVREVLNIHLDLTQDSSMAIRSVYGRWFPWLTLLDRNWATQNVVKIFPQDETEQDLRRAAWESYLNFCDVYDDVFDMLKAEYYYEVERIDTAKTERRNLTKCEQGFARHLMTLYWRGKLNLNEPEGLLTRFYAKASDTLRGDAMKFVGRSLENTKEAIPSEILGRLQLLLEMRLHEAKNSKESTAYTQELAAFGWCFIAGKFDDSWAIEQLKQVLQLVGKIKLDSLVVKQLATLADTMPESTFECLSLMIKGDKQGWSIYRWRDSAKTILAAAIQGNNDTAKQSAIKLIHQLGESGNLEFRDLLPVKKE